MSHPYNPEGALALHHKNELEILRLEQELQHAKNRREMTHGYLRANLGDTWQPHYEAYKAELKNGVRNDY